MWTLSGLYFSWSNIDDIHGDHLKHSHKINFFDSLLSPSNLIISNKINKLELIDIDNIPFYWINDSILVNAKNGNIKDGISEEEAIRVAYNHLDKKLVVKNVRLILNNNSKHHEYRNKKFPVYAIEYDNSDKIIGYVTKKDGRFQTVRHNRWRIFDFLWMTHTMDYEGRDDINNMLLRIFSIFGLITVLSGFTLWFISSKTIFKIKNIFK